MPRSPRSTRRSSTRRRSCSRSDDLGSPCSGRSRMSRWDDDEDERKAKDPTEGVRIIGAEEAAEAVERGDVAPRRAEGELRFGDRPEAPPEGVRPAVRFPLPEDEDPAAIRPRVTGAPGPTLPHW